MLVDSLRYLILSFICGRCTRGCLDLQLDAGFQIESKKARRSSHAIGMLGNLQL